MADTIQSQSGDLAVMLGEGLEKLAADVELHRVELKTLSADQDSKMHRILNQLELRFGKLEELLHCKANAVMRDDGSPESLRRSNGAVKMDERKYDAPLCKFEERCTLGSKCRFSHSVPDSDRPCPDPSCKRKDCSFKHLNKCVYGKNCRIASCPFHQGNQA
eukprot:TRINITY_DN16_c0_g1_i12.p2 TRINITY_DN16_c0_g1~~TRINITY_DN16_c0_g1_i12.p2  ORF type:complete len:162 (-),score=42.73 TRINITY_DN16_c0_g1_i12:843-1328(-)